MISAATDTAKIQLLEGAETTYETDASRLRKLVEEESVLLPTPFPPQQKKPAVVAR